MPLAPLSRSRHDLCAAWAESRLTAVSKRRRLIAVAFFPCQWKPTKIISKITKTEEAGGALEPRYVLKDNWENL